jgi:hypothetical protein
MALVKSKNDVTEATQGAAAFDRKYRPGETIEFSGIYRCAGCGDEYALNQGNVAPPQNHHQHPPGPAGRPIPIEWKLLVYAQTR